MQSQRKTRLMGNNLSSTFIQSFPIIREKRNSRIARIEVNFLIKRINGKEERERGRGRRRRRKRRLKYIDDKLSNDLCANEAPWKKGFDSA